MQQLIKNMSIANLDEFVFDGNLIFTCTNSGYTDYTHNLYESHRRLNVDWKLCVVAFDEDAQHRLEHLKIPCVLLDLGLPRGFHCWEQADYKKIVWGRYDFMRQVMAFHPNVHTMIYMDSDIVLYKDILTHMKATPGFQDDSIDALFQCDESNTVGATCIGACTNVCTGVMVLKCNKAVLNVITYKAHVPDILALSCDQEYINIPSTLSKLRYKTLDRLAFPNGAFVRHDDIPLDPVLLHYNYTIGHEKRMFMRQRGDWYVNSQK